jgi:streptogramin lyase
VSPSAGVSAPVDKPPPPPFEIPAGWYDDPRGGRQFRYWDGEGWTDHVVPAPPDGAGPTLTAARAKGRRRLPMWLLTGLALAGFVLALILLEDPNQSLTDPSDAADLAQDIGGSVPGMKVTEYDDGLTGHTGGLTVGRDGNFWITEQFDDKFAFFDRGKKKFTEFAVPDGTRPHNAYTGPDGNIWFTGLSDNIGVFNVKSKKATVFKKGITKGAEPHVIITDPTNSRFMWFTEFNGGRISRFDRTTHKIVEFPLGGRKLPHGIIPDPNGKAIWWCEQGPDGLGRLDLSKGPINSQQDFKRHYKEFLGLPRGTGPHDPLFGPDGNIYTTLQDSNQLGRYLVKENRWETFPTGIPPFQGGTVVENRSGQSVQQATDPDSLRSFYTLANGSDGHTVFFNASVQNGIGMFDLRTNKIYILKKGITPGGGPLFVVQGPDKAIWFTEVGLTTNLPGRLGRLAIKR